MQPDGSTIPPPPTAEDAIFGMSYDYCVNNWCVNDANDSIFTYGDGESFSDINKCDLPYINEIENQVANPPEQLLATCGSSVACMVDGLCGDMSDALRALTSEALIETDNVPVSTGIVVAT